MLVLTGVHDLTFSPARLKAAPTDADAERLRRWVSWLGRLGMLAAIGVVLVAVQLVRIT
jgi:hypothetical protein